MLFERARKSKVGISLCLWESRGKLKTNIAFKNGRNEHFFCVSFCCLYVVPLQHTAHRYLFRSWQGVRGMGGRGGRGDSGIVLWLSKPLFPLAPITCTFYCDQGSGSRGRWSGGLVRRASRLLLLRLYGTRLNVLTSF